MQAIKRHFSEFFRIDSREVLFFGIVFIAAFAARIPEIGNTIVADEQLWILRSKEFAKALASMDFAGTKISNHPGVITMWLGGFATGFANVVFGHKSHAELLFAAQLPIVIATSLMVAAFYSIAKKAFNHPVAIVSTILLVLDPFSIAFSRIIHLDAILAHLMILSFLSLLVYFNDRTNKRWFIVSAILGGFSVLAKVPGIFLVPMMFLASVTFYVVHRRNDGNSYGFELKAYVLSLIVWILIAYLAAFIAWPAMWSNPLQLFELFTGGPGMVAHMHGQFFWGEPVGDPGALFYPVVIMFRTTPVSLAFLIAGIGFILFHMKSWRLLSKDKQYAGILLCLAYIVFFVMMMSIPGKKLGRYILPVFPAIALVSGYGIIRVLRFINERALTKIEFKKLLTIAACAVIALQLYSVACVYPYYLSHYNPLVGGTGVAQQMLLIGRGEGIDLVADYFNKKENADKLTVASEFSYLLRIHFKGSVMTTMVSKYEPDTIAQSDYLVVYISGLQKRELRLPEEVLEYHGKNTPEKIIRINAIDYAYIYNLRKATKK